MKPVGLTDPRTGRYPYACVQLRQENLRAESWNLVGFQNHLRFPEQKRVLRLIPGLEQAEFLRYRADPPQHVHQRSRAANFDASTSIASVPFLCRADLGSRGIRRINRHGLAGWSARGRTSARRTAPTVPTGNRHWVAHALHHGCGLLPLSTCEYRVRSLPAARRIGCPEIPP